MRASLVKLLRLKRIRWLFERVRGSGFSSPPTFRLTAFRKGGCPLLHPASSFRLYDRAVHAEGGAGEYAGDRAAGVAAGGTLVARAAERAGPSRLSRRPAARPAADRGRLHPAATAVARRALHPGGRRH